MKLYKNLYFSTTLEHHATTVVQRLLEGKIQLNTYVIVLTPPPKDQIEIYNITLNQQKLFSMDDVLVIGIARGHEEALELMEKIMDDVYKETGEAEVGKFIKHHQVND